MNNILILGSLPETENRKKFYELITRIAEKHASVVNSPIDTAEFEGSNKERYDRAFNLVKEADLIIGEQSNPSTGQGMEIREAAILEKPLIVIAKEGSKISGLVRDCPITRDIVYYTDFVKLEFELTKSIKNIF